MLSKPRNIREAGFCSVMVKRGENVNARIINIQFPITADTKKEQQCERNFSGTIIRGQTAKTARVTNSECDCRRGLSRLLAHPRQHHQLREASQSCF